MERINRQKTFNFLNKKNKWLGILDYKTIRYLAIYVFIIYELLNLIALQVMVKLYILVIFIFPFCIFIFLNLNEECIVDKFIIIVKFFIKRKKYVNMQFYKNNNTIYVENVKKNRIVKLQK